MKYPFFAAILLSAVFGASLASAENADTIYTGGTIVTVNDAQPSAEAVAVRAVSN